MRLRRYLMKKQRLSTLAFFILSTVDINTVLCCILVRLNKSAMLVMFILVGLLVGSFVIDSAINYIRTFQKEFLMGQRYRKMEDQKQKLGLPCNQDFAKGGQKICCWLAEVNTVMLGVVSIKIK